MTTFLEFANAIASPGLTGVTTLAGIPKTLTLSQLPVMWSDLPIAEVAADSPYATYAAGGTTYTAPVWIAVAPVVEALPDAQRTQILTIAEALRQWVEAQTYSARITTTDRVAVGGVEYRAITAVITGWDME